MRHPQIGLASLSSVRLARNLVEEPDNITFSDFSDAHGADSRSNVTIEHRNIIA
jgi:hypothetical protein